MKFKECESCFWNIASLETWKNFSKKNHPDAENLIKKIKNKKCSNCENASNYNEIIDWRCRHCDRPIDGHDYYWHMKLCPNCQRIVEKDNTLFSKYHNEDLEE